MIQSQLPISTTIYSKAKNKNIGVVKLENIMSSSNMIVQRKVTSHFDI